MPTHPSPPARKAEPPQVRNMLLKKLCMLLRTQTGHDFSQYKETTLLRRRLADITDPEDLPRVRTQLEAAMADGADVRVDKRYVRADGTRLRTHERVSALRDALGKPNSLLLVSFDLADEWPGPVR